MAVFKRGKQYWMDVKVRSQRYREPLDTTDWREAKKRERIQQIEARGPVPTGSSKVYAALDVQTALVAYARERRAQVSRRMAAYWLENAKPLAKFFGKTKLRNYAVAGAHGEDAMAPPRARYSTWSEVALRECTARTGLQVTLESNRRPFGLELDRHDHAPWTPRDRMTGRPVVVPIEAGDQVARYANIVAHRIRRALQDIDDPLLGFRHARREAGTKPEPIRPD